MAVSPANWPATSIELRDIGAVKPHPKNPKTHSAAQIEQVAKSMQEWGWTMPALVDENDFILAGHCRAEAARKNGYTTIPVLVARGWTDAQKLAYIIADNKLTENGEWDKDILGANVEELGLGDFNLALLGFGDAELKKLSNEIETPPSRDAYSEQYGVIVMCSDAGEQERVYNELQGNGYNCKVVTT